MVRFIINLDVSGVKLDALFTFQYGQIYYTDSRIEKLLKAIIYIPIWLDLL